jgi:diguanylate cyclase (GGDEF)-like protein/PAS domain S-box-containing protein
MKKSGPSVRPVADPRRIALGVLEAGPCAVLGVGPGDRVDFANSRAEALLGLRAADLVGMPAAELLGDGTAIRADGSAIPVEITRVDLDDGARALVVRDLSEQAAIEEELRRSHTRLIEAQQLARIGSWEWDVAAGTVTWTDELFRIYGLEPQSFEPTYEHFLERVHPDDRQAVDDRNRKAFADHEPFEDVKRVVRPDASVFLMRTQGEVITNSAGEVVRMIGICEDVTDARRAEEAQALLASIVRHSNDAIHVRTPEGTITSWNDAAHHLYGYTAAEVVGRRVAILVPPNRVDEERRVLDLLLSGQRVDAFETQRMRKDGTLVEVSIAMSLVMDADDEVIGVSAISRDITERKRFEAQLQYLASRDGLTDLFNRRRFEEELAMAATGARRYGTPGALLVLDLDNFKDVNDTLGHGTGDQLIRSIAAVLRTRLRDSDVLARLGGDEFAVLLPHATAEQARSVAEDVLEAVRHFDMVNGGQRVRVTTSIGGVLLGGEEDEGLSGEELLATADRAMYQAKDEGRDRVVLRTPQEGAEDRRARHMSWERRIRRALDEGGFILHAQPILDLATGDISQYELLLRLHDEEGSAFPNAFLSAAERRGLVHEIDRWVTGSAIDLIAATGLRLEVNLSARSVGDLELETLIAERLTETGIDPSLLVLEITETAAIHNIDEARRFAQTLTSLGCRFALDDFGVGFGSFSYLKYLPADYLKIDGDFIRSPRSRTDELVVESIVHVARGLGKQTIAEWVGDEETVELLRGYGVDFAQGFHTGKPFPVTELTGPEHRRR